MDIFNAHLLICLYVFAMLAMPAAAPLVMVAGEVASIVKTYRRISKCALNMNIDAISPIFLWNPYQPNHPIPNYKPDEGLMGDGS